MGREGGAQDVDGVFAQQVLEAGDVGEAAPVAGGLAEPFAIDAWAVALSSPQGSSIHSRWNPARRSAIERASPGEGRPAQSSPKSHSSPAAPRKPSRVDRMPV